MHQQQLKNPPLSAVKGLCVVICLVAALLLDSMLANLLAKYIGGTASKILFWVLGGCVAFYALRKYVLMYVYEMANGMLYLNFRYGRYIRAVDSFALRTLVAVGTPEEILPKYKGARIHRATLNKVNLPQVAAAYKYEGKVEICILQPDEEIHAALLNAVKR